MQVKMSRCPDTELFWNIYRTDGWVLLKLGVFIGAVETHKDIKKHAMNFSDHIVCFVMKSEGLYIYEQMSFYPSSVCMHDTMDGANVPMCLFCLFNTQRRLETWLLRAAIAADGVRRSVWIVCVTSPLIVLREMMKENSVVSITLMYGDLGALRDWQRLAYL